MDDKATHEDEEAIKRWLQQYRVWHGDIPELKEELLIERIIELQNDLNTTLAHLDSVLGGGDAANAREWMRQWNIAND